ncbi:hypothetical protein M501DRAFT_1028264 [Patellaria atrata CBS 101060]|uniref:Mis12 domain-containing protein n=1 Tax=Patellaria atrata CBS 101060 TaxID=1346257 RepID=A0A9P4SKW0_9PEZI|nr:hypothetical protein M501DRAFT_1028264 [Patellaria atrata CBS 101060]
MADEKRAETALLTEHLRYTPLTLLDDIINTINELIARAVDAAESGLLSAPPAALGFAQKAAGNNEIPETDEEGNEIYPEMRREIEEGVHQLETLLNTATDRNFDRFEIWVLRNVLTLSWGAKGDAKDEGLEKWVRLSHYEDLTLPTSDPTTPPPSPHALLSLRRKLQETQKLHTALLAEKARNDALLTQFRSLLTPGPSKLETPSPQGASTVPTKGSSPLPSFSFLTASPAAKTLGVSTSPNPQPHQNLTTSTTQPTTTDGPLTTNTAFTLSQLPSLRSLLAQLRPRLPSLSLPLPADADFEFGSERAQERREYVERQSRRVLERRGVDISGLGQGEGWKGREEVRALEEIVGMLGKGRGVAEADPDDGAPEDRMEE